jgi:aryl-alcohol dehydrogenase-like predicted oxidoreductase
MQYTHLGRSGLSVSRLCLGTMNFGPLTSEADAHAIMDAALEYGINFFDTANAYGLLSAGVSGLGEGKGSTESIIGRWFAQGAGRREKTVLATKLYSDMGEWPNDGKLSALNICRALDASLTRLQTDYIDLYQFHHVDRATPWDEIWQAIDVAVTAGKILYVGSSNFAGWHIAEAEEAARGSGAGRTLRAVSATRSGPHAPNSGGCRWSARTPPRPGRLTGPQQGQGLGFLGCRLLGTQQL